MKYSEAKMPDARRTHCRVCGGRQDEVGPISWRGKCHLHSQTRMIENNAALGALNDPSLVGVIDEPTSRVVLNRWRAGMILSAGGLLPEQLQPRS